MHASQHRFGKGVEQPEASTETDRGEIQTTNFTTPAPAAGMTDPAQVLTPSCVTTHEENTTSLLSVEIPEPNFTTESETPSNHLALAPLPALAPLTISRGAYKLTPQLQEQVCLLLQAGFSRRQAAAYLQLHPSTIAHAVARDEDFAASIVRAEELGKLQTDLCVIAASRKNWRAAAWLIQHRLKHPAPPTDEEKQAKHEARLADLEREHEIHLRRSAMIYDELQAFSPAVPAEPEWPVSRMKRKKK